MCIVFIYVYSADDDSDYKLIVISNRDEFYDRPSKKLGPWDENVHIYGGRDLLSGCEGGTWLAISTSCQKIGLLLNLPGASKTNAKSRGKIVENYIKSNLEAKDYIDSMRSYFQECNQFIFVAIEFGTLIPVVQTYNNATKELNYWDSQCSGFSNTLPDKPLKKVEFGKRKLEDVCIRYNKISNKEKLIDELLNILKSEESNLPDPQLEQRRPEYFKELSSIFVKMPKERYGTRAQTIMLVTKAGEIDIIELSMQSPIDFEKPSWEKTSFKAKI